MGKETKTVIRYRRGSLPEGLGNLLRNADENDLRVLVALQMLCDGDGIAELAPLAACCDMEQAEIDASLKFWRGAGVIGSARCVKRTAKETPEAPSTEQASVQADQTEPKEAVAKTAHRGGALERTATLGGYTSEELADLMEKRAGSAQFVDEANRILGKIMRTYDVQILMGLVDQLGFDEEAVLAILSYTVSRGKKTLRYAEQLAMGLYDEGIVDTEAVLERINRYERSEELTEQIRQMFGASNRNLSSTEKKLFTEWVEKYGYGIDVIRMAYDITVDNTQKPVPRYAATILDKWYEAGLKTAADVEQHLSAQREARDGARVEKSFDTEDFFEAAIQSSFGGMK